MANSNVLEGFICPNCESEGPFLISVAIFGQACVSDDGFSYTDVRNSETDWNRDMPITCVECDFTDEFEAFEAPVV